MIRPDYRNFRVGSQFVVETGMHLEHSAKGSTWEEHKYIKRVNGTYYPDSYEGGRHLPDGEKDESSEDRKVFDEFESFSKDLMKKGEAYWDDEEVSKMSKEELGELYENMTGVKLGDKDLDRLFNSREARKEQGKNTDLTKNDIENLAKEVIRGNFGNGQERKDLLGENYAEIQKRVNELMKGSAGQKKVSEATQESVKKAEEAAKKADNSKVHSGVDMDKVQSVYRNKKK